MPTATDPPPPARTAVLFDVDGTLTIPGSWKENDIGVFYPGCGGVLDDFHASCCSGSSTATFPANNLAPMTRLGFLTGSNLDRIRGLLSGVNDQLYEDGLWFGEMGLVGYLDGEKVVLTDAADRLRALRRAARKHFTIYEPHEILLSLLPTAHQPLATLEASFFEAFPDQRAFVEASTSSEAVDVTPIGFNKAAAIDYLHTAGYDTIHYLGDSAGDLSAIRRIARGRLGLGAVVGQSAPATKAAVSACGGLVLDGRHTDAVREFIAAVQCWPSKRLPDKDGDAATATVSSATPAAPAPNQALSTIQRKDGKAKSF